MSKEILRGRFIHALPDIDEQHLQYLFDFFSEEELSRFLQHILEEKGIDDDHLLTY